MKLLLAKFLLVIVMTIFANPIISAQELNKNLEVLKPLLNKTWEGKLKAPDGSAEFSVIRTFELMDKENVIKCTKINRDLGGYGEGYFYWDDLEKKIAYFFIENGGVFSKAFVTSENNTIIIEGKMTWPSQANPQVKQSFDFKNTFEFTEEGKLIDKWFQNAFGPWRPGHTIEFAAKEEKSAYAVLFYSGRGGNQDIYMLKKGSTEAINLTNHPAKDICPAVSPDGKQIAFLSDRTGKQEIYISNLDGSNIKQLTNSDESKEHPSFCPDGKKIVYIKDFGAKTEIWIMNADGSEQKQLTSNQTRDERPNISPDGKEILFMSNRHGNYEIYKMKIDGSEQTRITNSLKQKIFPIWSPDGKRIAYGSIERINGRPEGDITIINADGTNPIVLTSAPGRDENPAWSPNGKQIVFQSERDGNFEVYIMNVDGTNQQRLTNSPEWDGWASFLTTIQN